jgi:hypothetical protein
LPSVCQLLAQLLDNLLFRDYDTSEAWTSYLRVRRYIATNIRLTKQKGGVMMTHLEISVVMFSRFISAGSADFANQR